VHRTLRIRRRIEREEDVSNTRTWSSLRYKYRALRAADNATGHAAHQQSACPRVSSPAHYDYVCVESGGFVEKAPDRRFFNDNRLGIRPLACEGSLRAGRRILRPAVERRKKK
jgi:hypothetical protein